MIHIHQFTDEEILCLDVVMPDEDVLHKDFPDENEGKYIYLRLSPNDSIWYIKFKNVVCQVIDTIGSTKAKKTAKCLRTVRTLKSCKIC